MRAASILRARVLDSACKLRHLDAHRPSKHPDGGCANVDGRLGCHPMLPRRSANQSTLSGRKNRYARFWRLPGFECRITSYDRPPSGERFENLSLRSVQIRPHDCARIRSGLLAKRSSSWAQSSSPTKQRATFNASLII